MVTTTDPIDWDSPRWGGVVHESTDGSSVDDRHADKGHG